MMKLVKVLGLIAMISVVTSQSAMAGGSFSVFGAGVLPKSIGDSATFQLTGKFGFGGGAIGELMLSPRAGLEAGAIYLQRKYGATFLGVESTSTTSFSSIHIPVGLRLHANRVVSLQLGGFYDYSLETDGDANFGVQGGLRLSAPVSGSTALFVEGRYNMGLKEISGEKISDLALVMVGLTFGGAMR
jgi:hypothetical protein